MDWQSSVEADPPYSVVEEDPFPRQFASLVKDPKLRDDLQQTFDLDLAKNPRAFQRIPGTKLRAVTIACFPPLTVYFSVDHKERKIALREIHRIS